MGRSKAKVDEQSLPFASIPELNAALRSREVSCVELTKFFGRRLEKLGPEYNALAFSLTKSAVKVAKDLDDDFKRERFRTPLQGIPYAVKDLLSIAKFPTTWGAKPYADQVFDYDAAAIERLNSARALCVGKLSMIELAGGGSYSSASASLQGPCRNPWNKQYWSGGSSSGSGAAVAAGLVPFALGSETSGSILNPACYCGITGLRPTYGFVSRYGAMALSWTLDKIGVLARSAEDSALVLHAIAGADDRDPSSAYKSFYYTPQFYHRFPDLKIGYTELDWSERPEAPLRPAFANALGIVKSIGSQMVETRLPEFPYNQVLSAIIQAESASIFETLIRSTRVDSLADPDQVAGLKASLNVSALDYLKAMRVRAQIQAEFRRLFGGLDLLVAPTYLTPPDRSDQPFDETPPKQPETKGVVDGLIPATNLCGYPAISIPCGFVNGLPIGLQIVGNAFSENRLIAFAKEFQARTNFHKQHPPPLSA